jgi:hypothetical protein
VESTDRTVPRESAGATEFQEQMVLEANTARAEHRASRERSALRDAAVTAHRVLREPWVTWALSALKVLRDKAYRDRWDLRVTSEGSVHRETTGHMAIKEFKEN